MEHGCSVEHITYRLPAVDRNKILQHQGFVFAFSPFFFGNTSINEYLRPLVIVLALSLLVLPVEKMLP